MIFINGQVYVKSNSEIIKNIRSDQPTKYHKGVCGLQTSTWDARAGVLRRCGVKEDFKGLTRYMKRENHAAKYQSCALNIAKAPNFFNVEHQNKYKKSIGTLISLKSINQCQYTPEGNKKNDLTFETCIFHAEKARNRNICSDIYIKMSVSFY